MDKIKINNLITRRNLKEDVSRLQTRISEDNKRIVQIQVDRDIILGEREWQLAELKSENERLQQNMLELQKQHEALSTRYEEELRYRAETLNKHESIRKICEALEQSVEQGKTRYAQTKKDQEMIGQVYTKADLQVRIFTQMHVSKITEAEELNRKLNCQVKQMRMHERQMIGIYNESQKRAETTLREMCDLRSHANDLQRKYDAVSAELDKCNSTISTLQREKRNMINNINNQLTEAENILSKKDNDLKSAGEEIEALKRALANQEQFTKMQCDQNNELQDKLALMEEEHQKAIETNKNYKTKIEESTSMCEKLNNNIEKLQEEKERLIVEMTYQKETIDLYEDELELFKKQLSEYDANLVKITLELTSTTELLQKKNEDNEKLDTKTKTLRKDLSDAETAFTKYREAAEEKLKHQAVIIEEINNELALKTSEIIEMNKKLQSETHEHAELAVQIQKQIGIIEELQRELEMQTSTVSKEIEERRILETELHNKVVSIEEMKMELDLKTATIHKENEERSKLETDLQNKAASIEQMKMELALKTSAILTEKEERCKLEIELKNKAASIEEVKMELQENKSALEAEKAERTKLDAALQTQTEYFEIELNTAKENEKQLKEKVSRLESGIRAKDAELSKELGNFLSRRNEFEKEKRAFQEVIASLENRIENIMKEASNTRPVAPSMQPELDDNARMPPTPWFSESSEEWLPREALPKKRPRPESPARAKPAAAVPETQTKERRFFKSARKPYKKC